MREKESILPLPPGTGGGCLPLPHGRTASLPCPCHWIADRTQGLTPRLTRMPQDERTAGRTWKDAQGKHGSEDIKSLLRNEHEARKGKKGNRAKDVVG